MREAIEGTPRKTGFGSAAMAAFVDQLKVEMGASNYPLAEALVGAEEMAAAIRQLYMRVSAEMRHGQGDRPRLIAGESGQSVLRPVEGKKDNARLANFAEVTASGSPIPAAGKLMSAPTEGHVRGAGGGGAIHARHGGVIDVARRVMLDAWGHFTGAQLDQRIEHYGEAKNHAALRLRFCRALRERVGDDQRVADRFDEGDLVTLWRNAEMANA